MDFYELYEKMNEDASEDLVSESHAPVIAIFTLAMLQYMDFYLSGSKSHKGYDELKGKIAVIDKDPRMRDAIKQEIDKYVEDIKKGQEDQGMEPESDEEIEDKGRQIIKMHRPAIEQAIEKKFGVAVGGRMHHEAMKSDYNWDDFKADLRSAATLAAAIAGVTIAGQFSGADLDKPKDLTPDQKMTAKIDSIEKGVKGLASAGRNVYKAGKDIFRR